MRLKKYHDFVQEHPGLQYLSNEIVAFGYLAFTNATVPYHIMPYHTLCYGVSHKRAPYPRILAWLGILTKFQVQLASTVSKNRRLIHNHCRCQYLYSGHRRRSDPGDFSPRMKLFVFKLPEL
jgi:hypothetical protein